MNALPDPPPPLTALQLRFHTVVERPVSLNEHKGSAIRGALFHALRGRPGSDRGFCLRKELTSCLPCQLHAVCPISALVATVRPNGPRGVDPPRPFTIEPPLTPQTRFEAGEPFNFGVTLFGSVVALLPYLVSAVSQLHVTGIGQKPAPGAGRGTLRLERIRAVHPVTGDGEDLMTPTSTTVRMPALRIGDEDVLRAASRLRPGSVAHLDFLTPTRLTEGGRLVRRVTFAALLHRLIERRLALAGADAETRRYWPLLAQAAGVRVEEDRTHWVELDSYSTRRNAHAPLSGLSGRVTFAGELEPFLPWLVWGTVMHVGKEATKGNGWYRLL